MNNYFKKFCLTTAFILSLMLLISCETTDNPSAPEGNANKDGAGSLYKAGPSASGQGSITAGNWRIFSFHAVTHPNGSVSGSGVLKRNPNGTKIQFDIDCLSVDGNVAIMSGTITKLPVAPEFEGGSFWFKVVDNGEGANSDTDEITLFSFCPPGDAECEADLGDCGNDSGLELITIEAGNIQVKP